MLKKSGLNFKAVAVCALFAAVSIISGKYLAISIGSAMRFSFENLPIILAGIVFGPLAGALTGILGDLVGCILVGYTINPLITIGAAVIGALSGVVYKLLFKFNLIARLSVSVVTVHFIGSVIIKTFGLSKFYSMPFAELLFLRFINYVIVAILEVVILYFILKNKGFIAQTRKIKRNQ